jgi:hypothetical protein
MKSTRKRLWTLLLADLLFLLFSNTFAASAQTVGSFVQGSDLTSPRIYHTATLLFSGKVLITGGWDDIHGSLNRSAELFDPATNSFTPTGDMTTGRVAHTATLLADGRVLIAGGRADRAGDGTAELYDPSTGNFTATGGSTATTNLVVPGATNTATLLNNGKVLIAGGGISCQGLLDGLSAIVNRPQIYDPAIGTFTIAADYADRSGDCGTAGLAFGAPATLLPDGGVLIAGEPKAELYDPTAGAFRVSGSMTRGASRPDLTGCGIGGTATLLRDGTVLLAGGELFGLGALPDAELYNFKSGTFTAIGPMKTFRGGHTATLLRDGTVLVAGGAEPIVCSSVCELVLSSELYDVATGKFASAADMGTWRSWHTATLLMDGRVLITGGNTVGNPNYSSRSTELYLPSVPVPAQVVSGLGFDRTSVGSGSSYSANVSGSNLTPQTFFDVRFTAPGSTDSAVVLNWQKGVAVSHDVPVGLAAGSWTINGMRAHEVETDHTGIFFPVSATVTVSRERRRKLPNQWYKRRISAAYPIRLA